VIYVVGGYDGSNNLATCEAFVSTTILSLNMYAGLTIEGPVGSIAEIDYKDALSDANWKPLTNITLSTSPYLFIDVSATYRAARFYRAVPTP
jgi:hypothetical protein